MLNVKIYRFSVARQQYFRPWKVEFEVSFVERIFPYSVCQKNINELFPGETSRNNVLTEIGNDKDNKKKTLIILLNIKQSFHIL